jgi:hypothetical protein
VTRQKRASIALVGAAVIAVLTSMAAVAVDLGTAYLAKVSDQRVADSAAYAGALAYNASASSTTMKAAAGDLAVLNGLASGAVAADLVPSPSGDGNSAVKVVVTTAAPLTLAKILRTGSTLTVTATAYAEVKPNASSCIIALKAGGSGVTLSGGTTVTAANCAIASNNTVSVPCGTVMTTKTVDYDSAAVPSQCASPASIRPPLGTASVSKVKMVTADPLAVSAAVAGAFTHLAAVASSTGPAGPTVTAGAQDINFAYSTSGPASPPVLLTAIGCTGTFASSTWTVTCPAGGTYRYRGISLGGGITLKFAVGGSATNTYTFSGAINVNGAGATFGPGTYSVAGGIILGGGASAAFGAGTYNLGAGTVSCSGSFYSICNTGASMTFGAGAYTIAGGLYNGGNGILSLGAGSSANSFNIGASSGGYAINAAGGSTTTLGNMSSGTFQALGRISTGGGSTLVIGAAPAHDLNGALSLAGGATLGSGTFTVAGNVGFGVGGGGGIVTGSGVSIVTSGTFTVGAGYNSVILTGPGSGTLQNLVVASNGTGGATFTEGASGNSLSGAFYFPNAPIILNGAGSVGDAVSQCLQFIGATITLSGGSTLASTCSGLGGGTSGGTVVLVQ